MCFKKVRLFTSKILIVEKKNSKNNTPRFYGSFFFLYKKQWAVQIKKVLTNNPCDWKNWVKL